jgi:hypothetical protein
LKGLVVARLTAAMEILPDEVEDCGKSAKVVVLLDVEGEVSPHNFSVPCGR